MEVQMNVENLKKLALFLWDLPHEDAEYRFGMSNFNSRHEDPFSLLADKNVCSTVSCAIGWGPTAGIKPQWGDHTWNKYSNRHFARPCTREWNWMFSGFWSDTDNTPKGAAKRIFWFLERGGVPPVFFEAQSESKWKDGEYNDSYCDKQRDICFEMYKDWTPQTIKDREVVK
jgi:hypothetical protein